MNGLNRFLREEDGLQLAEEALLLIFIAVVSVIALGALGGAISGMFNSAVAAF